MKRIFSFALAAMMTITMGILPAFAEPHTHFIRFEDGTTSINLGKVTEGESSTFPLTFDTCGAFEVGLEIVTPEGSLPEGLSTTSAGAITFAPTEGAAGTYSFNIRVSGICPEGSTELNETLSCSITVVAPEPGPEHVHELAFDDVAMTPHVDGGFGLPDATVGLSYNCPIEVKKCEHIEAVITLEDGMLPDGLTLSDGVLSGTPNPEEEGYYEFKIKISASLVARDASVPPDVTETFRLTVQPESDEPEMITWRIPYIKQVERGGSRNPGSQTFELEIFGVGAGGLEDQVTIVGNTGKIDTNGSGDYSGHVSVTAPANALEEGFKVKEKDGNAARWTYSDAVYKIWPVRDASGKITDRFKIYEGDYGEIDGEGTEYTTMTFTNTYSYSPSYDRDDDDDDDRDRPDPKPEKVQPEKDEEKSNPVTGR